MNAKCKPLHPSFPISLLIYFFIGVQLLSFSNYLQCQNREYSFTQIASLEGLPQANILITAIFQDSDGFMWLGTEDGLARYDGYEFKVYRNNLRDTTSIGGNFVNSIAEDDEGNLWVTLSFKGLNKFDKNKEQFIHYDPEDSGIDPDLNWLYLEIMEISSKVIWMKSYYRTTSHYLALNAENGTYYLQQGMAPKRSDTKWQHLITFHGDSILSIEAKWRLNLNSFKKNLLYKNSPKKYLDTLSHPKRRDFNNIIKDKNGNIWIGTDNGLYQFLPGSDSVNSFFHVPNCEYSLNGNSILSLFEDRSGNIWIGSNGLNILENNKKQFFTIKNTLCKSNLLTTIDVRSILEINDNELLVGLTDFGVNHLQLNPLQLHGKEPICLQDGRIVRQLD